MIKPCILTCEATWLVDMAQRIPSFVPPQRSESFEHFFHCHICHICDMISHGFIWMVVNFLDMLMIFCCSDRLRHSLLCRLSSTKHNRLWDRFHVKECGGWLREPKQGFKLRLSQTVPLSFQEWKHSRDLESKKHGAWRLARCPARKPSSPQKAIGPYAKTNMSSKLIKFDPFYFPIL